MKPKKKEEVLVRMKDDISCYQHMEVTTHTGQLVELGCRSEDDVKRDIKQMFIDDIRTVDLPSTTEVDNVGHGGYGRYSRFKITQYKYGGGGHPGCGGFIEVLEIHNPPDGRCGNIIHIETSNYDGSDSVFYEYETIEDALNAREKHGSIAHDGKREICKGHIRTVKTGNLTPWFYAVGDQAITGDTCFPRYVGEHPVFQPLKKFVVRDGDGFPEIKTCMGSYTYEQESGGYWGNSREKKKRTRVMWSDGTHSRLDYEESTDDKAQKLFGNKIEACTEDHLFIHEAMSKFSDFLSGKNKKFEMEFMDGSRFVGEFKSHKDVNSKEKNTPGSYRIRLLMEGNVIIERDFKFNPTVKEPTVEDMVWGMAKRKEKPVVEILCLEKLRGEIDEGEWHGVFPSPNRD